jgi:double-stranded uracil-DNA glycosylase
MVEEAQWGVPDIIQPGLDVLFCGINPGLASGQSGHAYARPGNRFWKALHLSGFTPRQLHPSEQQQLLTYNLGSTNFVSRTTLQEKDLTASEIREGKPLLEEKIARFKPQWLAVMGLGAYRIAFHEKNAVLGLQPGSVHQTKIWVLPNPSGLNARYRLPDLVALLKELRQRI